jgi:hypothetical protein
MLRLAAIVIVVVTILIVLVWLNGLLATGPFPAKP